MAKQKQEAKACIYTHREDAEWLSIEICSEYQARAKAIGYSNARARHELMLELQHRCDITEIQATNMLNGFYARDYVGYYERMRNHTLYKTEKLVDLEYLEWLAEKEAAASVDEFGYEERDW